MIRHRYDDLRELVDRIVRGEATPAVDRTYPLAAAAEPLRDLEAGRVRGKRVIRPIRLGRSWSAGRGGGPSPDRSPAALPSPGGRGRGAVVVSRTTSTATVGGPRAPLTRARVLAAAVALADAEGLDALTMRRLAQDLGVEAMSLYHHVRNKDALLAGVVDVLFEELHHAVGPVDPDAITAHGWRTVLRARILCAREVMLRHPWLPRVLEEVTSISLAAARFHEGVLGTLIVGGFSYDLAHHALHALGSRAMGFTQELFEPDDAEAEQAASLEMMESAAQELPHLVAMMQVVAHEGGDGSLGWCDDQVEFEFGLDVLLEGLERRLAAER